MEEIRLLTASNGADALHLLASENVDLLVTDLTMPVVDGFQVLAHVMRTRPAVPTIVMTAYGSATTRSRVNELAPLVYIEKPFDPSVLAEKIRLVLRESATGRIQGVTLPSILQLLSLERKSCYAHVSSQGREGFLHFAAGELVHAHCGQRQGEDAAYEILGWNDPEVQINPSTRPARRTVRKSLEHVVLEAAALRDERSLPEAAPETVEPSEPEAEPERVHGHAFCEERRRELHEQFLETLREIAARESRSAFLLEAGVVLASSLDESVLLSGLTSLLLSRIADWYVLDMAEVGGELQRKAVLHRNPLLLEWAEELRLRGPGTDAGSSGGWPLGLRELRPRSGEVWSRPEELSRRFQGHLDAPILERLGLASVMVVPMTACGDELGLLTLVSSDPRRLFTEDDLEMAKDLAHRTALAITNARRFAAREAASPDAFAAARPQLAG